MSIVFLKKCYLSSEKQISRHRATTVSSTINLPKNAWNVTKVYNNQECHQLREVYITKCALLIRKQAVLDCFCWETNMPPKPKQYAKKSTTTNSKNAQPPKIEHPTNSNGETSSGLSQEAEDQFELELCWCIQQLEMCLAAGKLPDTQARDLCKNINILKSNTAPLIKKRQVMRNTLGNYREKMALDEQKLSRTASSIKFMAVPKQNKKSIFFKTATHASKKETQPKNNISKTTSSEEKTLEVDNVQNVFKFNFEIKE